METTAQSAPDPKEEIRKLKTEFLANLNHEIRTPLSGILGMMDLLDETELSDEQREYTGAARMCAEDLLRHLNTALEYSALAAGQLKLDESEFNLAECLQAAVELYQAKAQAKGLRLELAISGGNPGLVVGDAARVRDILSHLIDNALKFTVQGDVAIAAEPIASGESLTLAVTVADTGIGIAPGQFAAIFDSFHQIDTGYGRRYAGLGLGLALVQRLVVLMGGEVEVASQPGQGSRFRVTIPLRLAPESTGALDPAESGHRVLVVEDDELGLLIAEHILRRSGFDVETASNGEQALAKVVTRPFSLILMDLEMPGISGFETTRAIRALPDRQNVPIVALTAHTEPEYRDDCLAAGMQGFLSKPLRGNELLAVVRKVLR